MVTAPVVPEAGLALVNEPVTFWRGSVRDAAEIWQGRELLRAFVGRELKSRYKGAALGWTWSLLRPLAMLAVYGVAIGVFLGAGRGTPEFGVYIYSGLLAWGFFTQVVLGSMAAVLSNGSLVAKARFPRLMLPLSVVASSLLDFVLQASVLLLAYAVTRDLPRPSSLLWLVPSMAVLLLVSIGVAMFFAAANVYVRDMAFVMDVGLQVGFWTVPVVYPYANVVKGAGSFGLPAGLVQQLYLANPLTPVVLGFQRALWPPVTQARGAAFAYTGDLGLRLGLTLIVAAVLAWLGTRAYVRMSGNFGQEV